MVPPQPLDLGIYIIHAFSTVKVMILTFTSTNQIIEANSSPYECEIQFGFYELHAKRRVRSIQHTNGAYFQDDVVAEISACVEGIRETLHRPDSGGVRNSSGQRLLAAFSLHPQFVDWRSDNSTTALMCCAASGDLDTLDGLLRLGAEPHLRTNPGRS